uniref:Disease resistance N-terminal domain-containing protein n=1 Tax=Leersia perrieri TaxID=77586 RepID=A0A0D9XPD7_9ORYZ
MDILISAVASDLLSRLFSYLIQKYEQQHTTTGGDLVRLRNVLLRIHTVVEEAESRQIRNQGMILQLKGLMEGMFLGYYVLDTFKFQSVEEEGVDEDQQVSRKRLCFSTGTSRRASLLALPTERGTVLKNVLESLEIKISDVRELVMLLASCPPLPQQPYSTYLFMDKCMFGRHGEKEQVIDFILHDDQNLAVLPIIGPHRIGKRTLVHHACQDERVRDHFLDVVFLHGDDLGNISLIPSRKYLCIVEFSLDVDVEAWKIFRSYMKNAAVGGSKVIIIGRTDEILQWGTVQPIRLQSLSPEMYWYYFKELSFGSMNPDEHPKLAFLGMQVAKELQGSFLGANILGHILRANPNAAIWNGILRGLREMSRNRLSVFTEHPPEGNSPKKNHPSDTAKLTFLRSRGCMMYDLREVGHFQSNIPRLTPGGVELEGEIPYNLGFDVLVWISRIPPFCKYVATFWKPRPRRIVRRKNPLAVTTYQHDLV